MASEQVHMVEEFRVAGPQAVDRSRGIIRGVKVIGFESKNGRRYPPEVLKRAVAKYEGAKVNIDHPPANDPGKPRSVADRFGTLRGVRFVEGKGIFGDLHFNPKHRLADQVSWSAENDPGAMGLSHNSYVRMGRGGNVEEVMNIRSVDLVADPATTNGVFESIESSRLAHQITERTDQDWLQKITGGKTATEQHESEQQGVEWLKRIARRR